MKKLFFAFAFLLCAMPARAQLTTVSGTIKGTDGVAYAGAQAKMQLVTTAGSPVSGQPTMTVNNQAQCVSSGFGSAPCQVPFQGTVGPFQISASGSFTINLQDNTLVTPAATQWLFTVNSIGAQPPIGTGPQVCTSQVTISGSAQTLSLASCPALSNVPPGSAGQFSVKNYSSVGDAKHSNNCQFNANTTLTCADNPFSATDVGKLICCVYPPTPTNETPAGTKITGFTSPATVIISNAQFNGGGVTGQCTWATQDDTSAFQQAFTAATPGGTGSFNPSYNSPTLAYPGTIVVPPGGYMVSGNIYDFSSASNQSLAPSFIGGGSANTAIYPRSDTFTAGTRACLMDTVNATNFTWKGFSIFGSGWGFNCGAATIPFMRLNVSTYFTLDDIFIGQIGVTNGGTPPVLNFIQVQNAYVNQTNQQGSSSNHAGGALFQLDNSSATLIEQSFFSNNSGGPNLVFNATGVRNATGQQVSLISGGSDECAGGTNECVFLRNASFVNFIGATVFGEPTGAGHGALDIDGTSGAYLSSMNVGPFSTSANSNGLTIASGGFVYATGSHIRGGGTTGSVIDAPAGATFVDDGGNIYQRCLTTTCTGITPATYSGAFTSGIVPKSSLTHTPNTCYAVTGNLLATAQNICIILLDQNYQLLTMSAQSGGTTPTNSACATPPVITLSDGTRSATMTMTSGKTQWFSNVDSVTNINQVFASGATLTVSIGANTCATPPSNVSVNYDLQSVLNQ